MFGVLFSSQEVQLNGYKDGKLFLWWLYSEHSCSFSKWAKSFQSSGPLLYKQRDSAAPTLTVFVCHTSCYHNSMWPCLPHNLSQWFSDVCQIVYAFSSLLEKLWVRKRKREPSYPVTVSLSQGLFRSLTQWWFPDFPLTPYISQQGWNRHTLLTQSWLMIYVLPHPVFLWTIFDLS